MLAFAVVRPHGLPEALVAVPTAGLVIGTGAVTLPHARAEADRLLPVVGFLAAVLVIARLCDDEGLFISCGAWMARAGRSGPRRLLAAVFVTASLTTAMLSLDATVVLLTPVVLVTAARSGARPAPNVHACVHLANSASLLLPVSNLTNLLAFAASGVSFARFAALMSLPWLVAVAVEYAIFRRFFSADLAVPNEPVEPVARPEVPVFTLAVVGLTLAGFVVTSFVGIDPVWAAFAGAVALAVRALAQRRTTVTALVDAASVPFLLFVLAQGVVVRAVTDNGLATAVAHLLPHGASLPALLAVAAFAAVLANLINNLPAVLALLPVAALGGTGPVLATLIGVNIGPNLTYVGSLATLLWRRALRERGAEPPMGEFTRLGLLTVPPALVASVVALWVGLRVT